MGRRTILLIAALVVAALGTVLVFLYAHNANNRAVQNQSPVQVLVAKNLIAAGTSAQNASNAGDFQLQTFPKDAVPDGALSDISSIKDQVALAAILPGQFILAAEFGTTATAQSLPIPSGKIAISISLADPGRVAGFVVPGSNIAIFTEITPTGAPAGGINRLLLKNVPVIAVGNVPVSTTQVTNPESLPRTLFTVAVTERQAQQIIFAQTNGTLYFGLLTKTSLVPTNLGPVSYSNLFG
jgi:pilus assembly protein CpaB